MLTELRYERWLLPLSVPLGLGPKKTEVRIADGTLHVKMGWGFEAHIPVMLRSLVVSVTDPDALIAACTGATA